MHGAPLFLSHWDASIPISVPANVVEDLKNYHIMGVRFLYDCFRKMQNGAILNHENGMNYPIQISAFLNALHTFITPESPVLIVCSEQSINAWHYHLSNQGGFDVTLLSATNCEEILNGEVHRVILATVDSAKLLREIKESDFFAVVVDELDKVATKTIIKQLKSQFNIGLTNRNFLKHPDPKLFWTMLKWSNPNVVGKLDEFCEEDSNHLRNLRYPYGAWWQRLTWKFCDTFKVPTDEEEKQYKKRLRNWSTRYSTSYNDKPKPEIKRQIRKRRVASEKVIKHDLIVKEDEGLEDSPGKHWDPLENAESSTKNLLTTSNNSKKCSGNLKSSHETLLDKENNTKNLVCIQESNQSHRQNFNSLQKTVVYDFKNSPCDSTDDNPILTSMVGGFDKCKVAGMSDKFDSGGKEEKPPLSKDDVLSILFDEPKSQTDIDDDSILTSIIKGNSNTQELESQHFSENSPTSKTENSELQNSGSSSRKNEILSLLYGETD